MRGLLIIILGFFFSVAAGKCRLLQKPPHTCTDWEMFEQCKRAQQMLDLHTHPKQIHLKCYRYMECPISPLPTPTGQYWCQNMDAYNLCRAAEIIVGGFKGSSRAEGLCYRYPPQVDAVPVLDYYQDRNASRNFIETLEFL